MYDDDRQSGKISTDADFPGVRLPEVVKKYVLRPEHFIIGLKTTGRATVFTILSVGWAADGAGDHLYDPIFRSSLQ
jgi:hypothetical protein